MRLRQSEGAAAEQREADGRGAEQQRARGARRGGGGAAVDARGVASSSRTERGASLGHRSALAQRFAPGGAPRRAAPARGRRPARSRARDTSAATRSRGADAELDHVGGEGRGAEADAAERRGDRRRRAAQASAPPTAKPSSGGDQRLDQEREQDRSRARSRSRAACRSRRCAPAPRRRACWWRRTPRRRPPAPRARSPARRACSPTPPAWRSSRSRASPRARGADRRRCGARARPRSAPSRHAQPEARVGQGALGVVRELARVDPHLALEGGAARLEDARPPSSARGRTRAPRRAARRGSGRPRPVPTTRLAARRARTCGPRRCFTSPCTASARPARRRAPARSRGRRRLRQKNGCTTSSGEISGSPSASRAMPSKKRMSWSACERELARAVVGGALAHHDQVARVAGGDERALQARDQPEEERASRPPPARSPRP